MAYRLQARQSTSSDNVWLALLIQTFESASRGGAEPLDVATINGLKAQLARPAASSGTRSDLVH